MATFLLKTEPTEFSFDALSREGVARWDGVSNPAANKHLRSVKKGDLLFIFHTGEERAIVGVAQAMSEPYADPARPELTGAGEIKFVAIDVKAVAKAKSPVSLATIKQDERFAEFPLVTQGRLSVMPVPAPLAKILHGLAGTKDSAK